LEVVDIEVNALVGLGDAIVDENTGDFFSQQIIAQLSDMISTISKSLTNQAGSNKIVEVYMLNAAGERRGFLIGDSEVSLTPTDCDHGICYILNANLFVTLNANFKCRKTCFIYLQGIIR
jgi:hypothetical protein